MRCFAAAQRHTFTQLFPKSSQMFRSCVYQLNVRHASRGAGPAPGLSSTTHSSVCGGLEPGLNRRGHSFGCKLCVLLKCKHKRAAAGRGWNWTAAQELHTLLSQPKLMTVHLICFAPLIVLGGF